MLQNNFNGITPYFESCIKDDFVFVCIFCFWCILEWLSSYANFERYNPQISWDPRSFKHRNPPGIHCRGEKINIVVILIHRFMAVLYNIPPPITCWILEIWGQEINNEKSLPSFYVVCPLWGSRKCGRYLPCNLIFTALRLFFLFLGCFNFYIWIYFHCRALVVAYLCQEPVGTEYQKVLWMRELNKSCLQ